jgi:hypothetical protein
VSLSLRVGLSAYIDLHIEKYLRTLVGRKGVEDALQRLDQLTQEEARMTAIEVMEITRDIDDKVKDVKDKVWKASMRELCEGRRSRRKCAERRQLRAGRPSRSRFSH